jgi:isoquinoline 1-oxidoreductase beta subunit
VVGEGGMLLHTGINIPYYEIANQNIERRGVSHGIRLKHWRAVGHVFNVMAIESMVDRMAVDAKMDPIDFRFQRMSITPKHAVFSHLNVRLEGPRPEGRALGLSSRSAPALSAPARWKSRSTGRPAR